VNAYELYHAGKLDEAIELLSAELRSDPTDVQRRTFLFELLGFAGELDRAEKQLDVIAQGSPEAGMGALLYQSALHAERIRQQMFRTGDYPSGPAPRPPSGMLNGARFQSIQDGDPRIGARLEVFAAGQYTWIPLEHIASVSMSPPKRLRDLLWAPASVLTGPGFKGIELGEVLIPVMAPLSWQHSDSDVRLGRVTEWKDLDEGGEAPVGQKLFLVDDEVFPILEVRELEIGQPSDTTD
jgi:type VI secretion system protein ImpE